MHRGREGMGGGYSNALMMIYKLRLKHKFKRGKQNHHDNN